MYEQLRNKGREDSINREFKPSFMFNEVKSAVEGLIEYHECQIEHFILLTEEADWEKLNMGMEFNVISEKLMLQLIDECYKSLMAIEHWLEDVIYE